MTQHTTEVVSIKGFDANLQCRGYQFAIGATYEHDGPLVACKSGFHAVDGHPLEVFSYYAPAGSRFAEVRQSGSMARDGGNLASARITIGVEITLSDLIQRAVKWVFDRATPEGGASATGLRGAASATGWCGAASATGLRGAASATGESGAASATGQSGAAMAVGHDGRVMGAEGCALFLVYRDPSTSAILHAWAGIAGRNGIKPMTWYRLDSDGHPVELTV